MEATLDQLKPGERARVVQVKGEGRVRMRIFDMGLTPGTEITFRKVAPLGDPIEITVRGYELSLRKNEAQYVVIEKL